MGIYAIFLDNFIFWGWGIGGLGLKNSHFCGIMSSENKNLTGNNGNDKHRKH